LCAYTNRDGDTVTTHCGVHNDDDDDDDDSHHHHKKVSGGLGWYIGVLVIFAVAAVALAANVCACDLLARWGATLALLVATVLVSVFYFE